MLDNGGTVALISELLRSMPMLELFLFVWSGSGLVLSIASNTLCNTPLQKVTNLARVMRVTRVSLPKIAPSACIGSSPTLHSGLCLPVLLSRKYSRITWSRADVFCSLTCLSASFHSLSETHFYSSWMCPHLSLPRRERHGSYLSHKPLRHLIHANVQMILRNNGDDGWATLSREFKSLSVIWSGQVYS